MRRHAVTRTSATPHPADEPTTTAGGAGGTSAVLLEVCDLDVRFVARGRTVHAVNGLTYSVARGRTLAIIGESGSGKTVSSRAVVGLLPASARVSGSIRLEGRELVGHSEREMSEIRGSEMAMIFQDPARSLNPTMRIGAQIVEAIRLHREVSRTDARAQAEELLRRVRIPAAGRCALQYPHELSGGMRQRVMIAIALACNPKLLIADEATTALDVTTQAQIMVLLRELQSELGTAIVLISHDMGLAASYADDVLVMYAGRAAEGAPAGELFDDVRMPYTRALMDAIPRMDGVTHGRIPVIGGRPPDLSTLPDGCAFADRCPRAQTRCVSQAPAFAEVADGHRLACWNPLTPTEAR